MQLTIRELQSLFASPRLWMGLVAVIAILTIAGPFGTDTSLNFAERFVYWGIEATLTFFCGFAVAATTYNALSKRIENRWALRIISAIAVGFPISVIVWVINLIFFGSKLASWSFYLSLLGTCLVISFAVTMLYYLIRESREDDAADASSLPSPFFKRLPKELGKNLLHISSQDHYVEAVTDRGSHMVLMRFADALEELGPEAGIQIHRSHWVCHSAITKTVRKEGRLFVETSDSREFPISRNYMKAVREELQV